MKTLTRYFGVERSYGGYGAAVTVGFAERGPAEVCICGRQIAGVADFFSAYGVLLEGSLTDCEQDNVGGIDSVVWSERAVRAFENAGLGGFRAYPIRIFEVGLKNVLLNSGFCAIEITGRLTFDRGLFDNFEGELCEKCGSWRPAGRAKHGAKVKCPIVGEAKTEAFCKGENFNAATVFCERRVVEVFIQAGLSGFGITATAPGLGIINLSDPDWEGAFRRRVSEVYPQLV